MTTPSGIDGGTDGGTDLPPPAPAVALRLVATHDGTTRRADVSLGGTESLLVVDDSSTPFPTERLWPVLRDLLPPLPQLRADPRGRLVTAEQARRRPGPRFADDCVAHVAVATVVDEQVTVRTWLATADDLWSVDTLADGSTEIHLGAEGALADLLVWDVTAALEVLVHRLEQAS